MNPSKVDAVALLSLLVLAAGAYFGVFRTAWGEKSRLDTEAERLQASAAEGQGLRAELDKAQQVLRPLRESARTIEGSLTQPGNADQFLGQLAGSARKADIEIRLLRPGDLAHGEGYSYLPVELVAVAPFPRLHQFLAGLERLDQLATVEAMSITSDLKSSECEASLTLHLHLPANGKPL